MPDRIKAVKKRTKRRSNGEGSIYQRADGRWVATITIGRDAVGKVQRRTVYGKTKGEVNEKLIRLQSDKLSGMLPGSLKTTVASFLGSWLENSARPSIRETTHANYKRVIELHITPLIGGLSLARLSPAHVQGLYAEMQRKGASAHTRLLAHAVLHRAFKQAMRWGLMPRNVCDAVDPPRLPKAEQRPLDVSEAGKLLAAAKGDRLEALYILAVGSGMRLGELFGLQWADIDLAARSLTVRHTLTELNGLLTLSEPKTERSRRRIELSESVVRALEDHRKRALAEGNAASPWVFCNTLGGPLRRSHFHRQDYKPLLQRAGLPDIRFHDLRHSHATILIQQGTPAKVVQERLGHSQISVTLGTYSHVMPTMQREATDQLDAALMAATERAAAKPKAATA